MNGILGWACCLRLRKLRKPVPEKVFVSVLKTRNVNSALRSCNWHQWSLQRGGEGGGGVVMKKTSMRNT